MPKRRKVTLRKKKNGFFTWNTIIMMRETVINIWTILLQNVLIDVFRILVLVDPNIKNGRAHINGALTIIMGQSAKTAE